MIKQYTIRQAYRMNRNGRDVPDGWDLFCGENWCQRFYYKSDAKVAMIQAQEEDKCDTL